MDTTTTAPQASDAWATAAGATPSPGGSSAGPAGPTGPDGPTEPAGPAPAGTPRRRAGLGVAGLVAAALVVGGGAGYALTRSGGTATSATGSAASSARVPDGRQGGQLPGDNGSGAGGAAGAAGELGFTPTDYRISGTVTAVSGNGITIKTSSGNTTTYTVTSTTHLLRDNRTVTLSGFQVGDTIVGSTTTEAGTTLNDLLAGMGGPGGGPGSAPTGSAPTS